MEIIEEMAIQIKAVFEDIEVYNLAKIENEIFTDADKLTFLNEAKEKLILLIDDLQNFEDNI